MNQNLIIEFLRFRKRMRRNKKKILKPEEGEKVLILRTRTSLRTRKLLQQLHLNFPIWEIDVSNQALRRILAL
jgi:hypothetical protein